MSEVNIDAALIDRGGSTLTRTDEKLVEMTNGCICCTLRDDLLIEVRKLATEGKFDYLVIEGTGVAEPLPIASTFDFQEENGQSLSDVARIDTMVTVVDAANLVHDYNSTDFLSDRGESAGEGDDRKLVDLLIEQIEFADVILLNKTDLITPDQLAIVRQIVLALNAKAQIIETSMSKVPLECVLNTGLFSMEAAADNPRWAQELYHPHEHTPETEEYGITSFVYRARLPFNPKKINAFFESKWAGIIRAKGFFWIATRPDGVGEISKAGRYIRHKGIGHWWAALPEQAWPKDAQTRESILKHWSDDFGDRRQELVFIGFKKEMDEAAIRRTLDDCLVMDYLDNVNKWDKIHDTFPQWPQMAA
jgi:G3E family GTPase